MKSASHTKENTSIASARHKVSKFQHRGKEKARLFISDLKGRRGKESNCSTKIKQKEAKTQPESAEAHCYRRPRESRIGSRVWDSAERRKQGETRPTREVAKAERSDDRWRDRKQIIQSSTSHRGHRRLPVRIDFHESAAA